MNTTSNVTTNATVSTLMSFLNAEYNMNKVADYVHMKESRTIDSRYINISTYDTICTVEETTVTDETFTLIEGRYADECEHDTAYHSDCRQSPGIAGIFYCIHRFSGIMILSERRCFL